MEPATTDTVVPAATGGAPVDPLDDLLAGWFVHPGTGFAVGTFGAVAEFLRPPDVPVTVTRADGVHTASCPEGAVRIDRWGADELVAHAWRRPTGTDGWTQAVALCLPTARAAGPARTVVTVLGEDPDPVLAPGVLVDLGLGVAHLEACVRVDDGELLDACRAADGRPLDGPLIGALLAAGTPRVFRTVIARAEVTTPIPPPDGESPMGPHTHLLPDLLAHHRTHAATDPIPDGLVPVASISPPHPARDAFGRDQPWDADAEAAFDAALELVGDPEELAATRAARAGRPIPELSRPGRRGWAVGTRSASSAEGAQSRSR